MTKELVADSVLLTPLPPLLAAEVEVRQPRLIDVDDASPAFEQLEHLLGVQHSRDEAPFRVASVLDFLDDPVAHIEVIPKHLPDKMDRVIKLFRLEEVTLDLVRFPYVLARLDVVLDSAH